MEVMRRGGGMEGREGGGAGTFKDGRAPTASRLVANVNDSTSSSVSVQLKDTSYLFVCLFVSCWVSFFSKSLAHANKQSAH